MKLLPYGRPFKLIENCASKLHILTVFESSFGKFLSRKKHSTHVHTWKYTRTYLIFFLKGFLTKVSSVP